MSNDVYKKMLRKHAILDVWPARHVWDLALLAAAEELERQACRGAGAVRGLMLNVIPQSAHVAQTLGLIEDSHAGCNPNAPCSTGCTASFAR